MNKTHKRELKKIPKRIKLKKEPTIIHPTDTYTITPVKYEKKKKSAKNFQRRVANTWYTDIE